MQFNYVDNLWIVFLQKIITRHFTCFLQFLRQNFILNVEVVVQTLNVGVIIHV